MGVLTRDKNQHLMTIGDRHQRRHCAAARTLKRWISTDRQTLNHERLSSRISRNTTQLTTQVDQKVVVVVIIINIIFSSIILHRYSSIRTTWSTRYFYRHVVKATCSWDWWGVGMSCMINRQDTEAIGCNWLPCMAVNNSQFSPSQKILRYFVRLVRDVVHLGLILAERFHDISRFGFEPSTPQVSQVEHPATTPLILSTNSARLEYTSWGYCYGNFFWNF